MRKISFTFMAACFAAVCAMLVAPAAAVTNVLVLEGNGVIVSASNESRVGQNYDISLTYKLSYNIPQLCYSWYECTSSTSNFTLMNYPNGYLYPIYVNNMDFYGSKILSIETSYFDDWSEYNGEGAENIHVGVDSYHNVSIFDGYDESFVRVKGKVSNVYLNGEEVGYFSVFASVPEPASWVMMVAGFGLLGLAVRRRERLGVA